MPDPDITDFNIPANIGNVLGSGALSVVALALGKRALQFLAAKAVGTEVKRIYNGISDRLTDKIERKLGLNSYSEEGRAKVYTASIQHHIANGQEDPTLGAFMRCLQLLDEPYSGNTILDQQFSPKTLAKEASKPIEQRKVFNRVCDYPETVTSLADSHDVLSITRDRLLAALVINLPNDLEKPIHPKASALIDTLRLSRDANILPGLKSLSHGKDPAILAGWRAHAGVVALLQDEDKVLSVSDIYPVIEVNPLQGKKDAENPSKDEPSIDPSIEADI